MHPAVLGAIGYALLLSSFVTLLILLRLKCKRQKKISSFYILSTSDVLSAALTAIILLVNHIETGIKMNYNWQSNAGDYTPNYTWTIENQSQHQFPPFLYILREAVDNTDLNVTLTCDMKDIFMQYGILLAALANAFVSLLTFVVQCNLSAACIKQRYASIIESSMNDARLDSKNTQVTCQERRMMKDEQESASQQQNNINATERSNGIQRFVQRIVEISKFQVLKGDDERPASYLVTTHWLVPFLVVGILYFAEYDDINAIRHTENTECIFESNFPMNDFYIFSDAENNPTINSITHVTTERNNYLLDEELSNKPSNIEIDQIVSKVQNIVRIVLNYTHDSAEDIETINFRNDSSGSRNTTEHAVTNDIIIYRENDTNINTVTQMPYDTSMDNATSEEGEDRTTSGNLNNVSQISSQKNDSHQEAAQIYFTSTEENTSHRITDIPIVRNTTFLSNDQIYNDIMKRIQAASVHKNATKNRYDSRDNGKQPKRNDLRSYTTKRKPYLISHLSFSETDRFNQYINSVTKRDSQVNLQYTINKCFLSMKFLKLHLFVLSFAIYFLPILFSCILQMRGRHTCKNTLVMLKANVDLVSNLLYSNSNKEKINAINVNKSPSELWLSMNDKKVCRRSSIEESDTPHEPNFTQSHNNERDIEAISEYHENDEKVQSQNTLEIDCMIRILDTVRLSLILCVLLWTPMFLGTLLRAFLCIQPTQWWNNVTFLSAISFGIIRNALNINIIKIQEVCGNANAKENRVHPIK